MGSNGLKAGAVVFLSAAVLLSIPKLQAAKKPSFTDKQPLMETLAKKRQDCKKAFEIGKDTVPSRPFYAGYLGAERLMKETPGDSSAARQYCSLVDSIAGVLKGEFGIKPGEPQRFMREILSLMYGNLHFSYGNEYVGYIGVSIREGKWDCDNSIFFVVDVARKLGIRAGFAVSVGHVLAVVGDRYYETVEGNSVSYTKEEAEAKYKIYFVTYDPKDMEYVVYLNHANNYISSNPKLALENVLKAIELVPEKAEAYYFAGCIYALLGNRAKAVEYAEKSIAKYACADTYNGAGRVYYMIGEYAKAIEYFKKALEIAKNADDRKMICENLALTFRKIGDKESALKYMKMVDSIK